GLRGMHVGRTVDEGKGGRKFVDVTKDAGDLAKAAALPARNFLARASPISFPSSTAFLDYDNDGLLDIFVCHYVEWSPKLDLDQRCTLKGGDDRAYCPPRVFKGTHCTLYRNLGNGKFEYVTAKAGIQA